MDNQRETNMKHNNCQIKGCGVCNPVHFKKDKQRDITEYKNLALWKEKEGYVIRKGFGRVGCYIDHLTRQDLAELKNFINIELATDKKWRERLQYEVMEDYIEELVEKIEQNEGCLASEDVKYIINLIKEDK